MDLITEMRVKHYIKNFLVFIPLFFSGNFFKLDMLLLAGIAFLSFSLMSSATYVINDLKDAAKDRLHPTKKIVRLHPVELKKALQLFFQRC